VHPDIQVYRGKRCVLGLGGPYQKKAHRARPEILKDDKKFSIAFWDRLVFKTSMDMEGFLTPLG